ncbi:MAG: hypothetical protein JNK72_06030 [Myxococcales bacterium]|nr:hypothetical protein [Myxococcales bacterium]
MKRAMLWVWLSTLGCSGVISGGAADSGATGDAAADAAVCRGPGGYVCVEGQRCGSPDGCNSCACQGGLLACTALACVDAGPTVSCRSSAECPNGQMCDGAEGCGVAWRCVALRACTEDLATYCGCDGETFQASGSCPGRPYRQRGACAQSVDAGDPACAPQDARGEGLCPAFFGYAWRGQRCEGVGGCNCEGAHCDRLAQTPEACEMAHAQCPR